MAKCKRKLGVKSTYKLIAKVFENPGEPVDYYSQPYFYPKCAILGGGQTPRIWGICSLVERLYEYGAITWNTYITIGGELDETRRKMQYNTTPPGDYLWPLTPDGHAKRARWAARRAEKL